MILALIWALFYIQDRTGFITMVSASTYYYTSNREKEGSASVMTGVKFAYFKHAGSIAFGSLVHTLVWILRVIVESVADQAQKKGNFMTTLIACCARCCVGCLENIIDFINNVAYAYMAVSGDSYCTSAWNGFILNLKHTMKFHYAN